GVRTLPTALFAVRGLTAGPSSHCALPPSLGAARHTLCADISLLFITNQDKTSLLGIFMRRLHLEFDKMAFSALSRLYSSLVAYCTTGRLSPLQLHSVMSTKDDKKRG